MTDDLLTKLRAGSVSMALPDGAVKYTNHVAADEIERLNEVIRISEVRIRAFREHVAELREALHFIGHTPTDVPAETMRKVAQQALEGK